MIYYFVLCVFYAIFSYLLGELTRPLYNSELVGYFNLCGEWTALNPIFFLILGVKNADFGGVKSMHKLTILPSGRGRNSAFLNQIVLYLMRPPFVEYETSRPLRHSPLSNKGAPASLRS